MTIRTTTIGIVRSWAAIQTIDDTLTELCILWATGHPAQPCGPALQPLIGDLKQGFPNKNLGGLRPSDMETGAIRTVEALISFIASSPSSAQPFVLMTSEAFEKLNSMESAMKRSARAAATIESSSKKRSSNRKKSGGKKTKAAAKKGRKGRAK